MSPVQVKPRRLSARRKALMLSCASAAMAAAILLPQRSAAQELQGAFQGSIDSFTGSVSRVTSGNSETITIGSPTATVNWNPYDAAIGGGPVAFLPGGNVATFTSTAGLTDYTVLNRIVPNDPTRSVLLDGSIVSTLEGTSSTGGNIWFYSPGGILVGSNALIDVGGLLLTTADLPNGFGANATSFSAFFSAPNSSSSIQIAQGAQVNAANSYVALIAPRIEQGGSINVNGSAAYVAAEQVTMSFNQGLFDISVDVGSDDINGVVHTGTTTGAGNATDADHHSIYMVAVPKNDALTMLLEGGAVGFSDVDGATVENGQIVLSAGYGVSNGFTSSDLGSAVPGPAAGLQISAGNFTSSVAAAATGSIDASGGGGSLTFAHDVTLQALDSSTLVAHGGETITVGGSASVTADDLKNFSVANPEVAVPLDAHGGTAAIVAEEGGSLQVTGDANVSADASPGVNDVSGESGASRGGEASIRAEGGAVSIGGSASVLASGLGRAVGGEGLGGAASYGGAAALRTTTGGSVRIGGSLVIGATGESGVSNRPETDGGVGSGGSALLTAVGGDVTVGGIITASARGVGGTASAGGNGGEGTGGLAQIYVQDAQLTFASANVDASGFGGGGASGGAGSAGYPTVADDDVAPDAGAFLTVRNASVTGNSLTVSANGVGGSGTNGDGGMALGGLASVVALNGSSKALIDVDSAGVTATATGGDGGNGGDGGAAQGGEAYLLARSVNGDLEVDDAGLQADATGGAGGSAAADSGGTGGSGGAGYGGLINVGTSSGLATTSDHLGIANLGTVFASAAGVGGDGGSGDGAGAGGGGGIAIGGNAVLLARGSQVSADSASTYADGYGGLGGVDGSGTVRASSGLAIGGSAGLLATNDYEGTAPATVDVGSFYASEIGRAHV